MDQDWRNWATDAKITCPKLSLMGYHFSDLAIAITQKDGKVSNLTIDTNAYEGKVHAVSSGDLTATGMPFEAMR